jgi:hypothetical protein
MVTDIFILPSLFTVIFVITFISFFFRWIYFANSISYKLAFVHYLSATPDKNIGFFIHPVLVLERESAFPLGIADVHVWNRNWTKKTKKERKYQSQPIEEKESYRWIEFRYNSKKALSESASITIVADREGDIYEEFVRVPDEKTDLVIRSSYDRKLYDSSEKLFEHFEQKKSMGIYHLEIGAEKTYTTISYNGGKIRSGKNSETF